jgi:Skp family chaperone for outer membrane proteins
MGFLSKIFASLLVLSVCACGGPSDTPPGPLAKHFDDMYIAAIPLDQKQNVVQTQNDWSLAKMENAKAEADVNAVNTQIEVSRNDVKAAKLAVDSANTQKRDADKSADTNRINQATKDFHNADQLEKAAEARVKYLEAYREYLKRHLRYAQENMYAKEASYELAKAQLGQRNNIAPKGIVYDSFPKQAEERTKRVGGAKDKAESLKRHALDARDTWLRLQKDADAANGHPSAFPDPMAPPPAPATAGGNAPPPAPAPAPPPQE